MALQGSNNCKYMVEGQKLEFKFWRISILGNRYDDGSNFKMAKFSTLSNNS